MILQCVCLFLVVKSSIARVYTIDPDGQIKQLSHSTNFCKAKQTRLFLRTEKDDEQDEWKDVNKGLVDLLRCTESAASHVPPITIGTYKKTIKDCTKNYSASQLKRDSEDALNKKTPRRYKPVITCFSKIDPKEDDENYDQDNHIPFIMQCLNKGGPKTTVQKKSHSLDADHTNSTKFAKAFERCILKNDHKGDEEKVNDCMSSYKGNQVEFYETFGPGSTRSRADYDDKQKYDVRAKSERKSQRRITLIIIDKRKSKKINQNHIYSKKYETFDNYVTSLTSY
ncbi:hypothetical protein O0L34_g11642 [Tuta absoluta]|nr:hypothetical protein O0L34_g11642 [Tuta absoluta]